MIDDEVQRCWWRVRQGAAILRRDRDDPRAARAAAAREGGRRPDELRELMDAARQYDGSRPESGTAGRRRTVRETEPGGTQRRLTHSRGTRLAAARTAAAGAGLADRPLRHRRGDARASSASSCTGTAASDTASRSRITRTPTPSPARSRTAAGGDRSTSQRRHPLRGPHQPPGEPRAGAPARHRTDAGHRLAAARPVRRRGLHRQPGHDDAADGPPARGGRADHRDHRPPRAAGLLEAEFTDIRPIGAAATIVTDYLRSGEMLVLDPRSPSTCSSRRRCPRAAQRDERLHPRRAPRSTPRARS
jgi:hypothetical protein